MVFNLKNNFYHIFRAYHYFLSTLIPEIGKHIGFLLVGGMNGIVRSYLQASWSVSTTQHAYLQKPRVDPCPLALREETLPKKIKNLQH